MSLDPFGAYRAYIQGSRGEFTVAKDQNVRLRSGWFSERAVCYLASGKPVVTQDTGFSNVLPTGAGLFARPRRRGGRGGDRGDQQRLPPSLRGCARDRGRALRGTRRGGAAARGRGARLMRHVIVNADDFGASTGTNRGIVECHTRGVLTSTSMMVTGAAVDEAVELSREHPAPGDRPALGRDRRG